MKIVHKILLQTKNEPKWTISWKFYKLLMEQGGEGKVLDFKDGHMLYPWLWGARNFLRNQKIFFLC